MSALTPDREVDIDDFVSATFADLDPMQRMRVNNFICSLRAGLPGDLEQIALDFFVDTV